MKKTLSVILVICLLLSFTVFALGSGSDDEKNQGSGSVSTPDNAATDPAQDTTSLGDYKVEIKSCRLAEDYEGNPVVIVLYNFTNVKSNDAKAFLYTIEDTVYQNGVGLNKAYVLKDSANYSDDNQSKEIKKGSSLDIEVAYVLNDTSTEIEVEVKEFISLSDKTLSKKFSIK